MSQVLDILREVKSNIQVCDDTSTMDHEFSRAIRCVEQVKSALLDETKRNQLELFLGSMRYTATREGGRMLRSERNSRKSRANQDDKGRASDRFLEARAQMVRDIESAILRLQEL